MDSYTLPFKRTKCPPAPSGIQFRSTEPVEGLFWVQRSGRGSTGVGDLRCKVGSSIPTFGEAADEWYRLVTGYCSLKSADSECGSERKGSRRATATSPIPQRRLSSSYSLGL